MVRKALKEWALGIKALETGRQILLLRKGGLLEGSGGFGLEADRFFLYPTRYHQEASVVKPQHRDLLDATAAEAPPEGVLRISVIAESVETIPVTDRRAVQAVGDHHIWSADYMEDRFEWKPESALFLLMVRAARLPEAHDIPLLPSYGGCTSWVDLEVEIPATEAVPVLDDDAFARRVNAIREALSVVA